MARGSTLSDRLSGTIQWSQASIYRGSGYRILGCRCLGEVSPPTSCQQHEYQMKRESMERPRRGFDLRGEDIRSCSRFSTRKSDMSIPWKPWVRSFWSSQDSWAGLQGFYLASNGLARTEVCQWLRSMPPNQSTLASQARDQHTFRDTITTLGSHSDGLHYQLVRVNSIGWHQDSRHGRPTEKGCNLLIVPEEYRHTGIGLALPCKRHLQAWHPGQHTYRLCHPVKKPILDPGMFSLDFWPSPLDRLPSTDGRADRASRQDNRVVYECVVQSQAGQLCGTLTTSGIRLQ